MCLHTHKYSQTNPFSFNFFLTSCVQWTSVKTVPHSWVRAWAFRPSISSTTGLVLQVYLWRLLTSAEGLSAAPKVSLCVAPRQWVSVQDSQPAVSQRFSITSPGVCCVSSTAEPVGKSFYPAVFSTLYFLIPQQATTLPPCVPSQMLPMYLHTHCFVLHLFKILIGYICVPNFTKLDQSRTLGWLKSSGRHDG